MRKPSANQRRTARTAARPAQTAARDPALVHELKEKGSAELEDGTRIEVPLTTFRRQLRETRKSADLSQTALASKVADLGGNLHSTAITRIERGDRDVSLEDVLILAAALDVSPLYLIFPRDDCLAKLTPASEAYLPLHLREWMRGQWPLAGPGTTRVSAFFASQRPPGEDLLWSNEYLVHRLCTLLAGALAEDILRSEGFLVSHAVQTPWPEESPKERLDGIERRLRNVVEEVESYLSRRRRQLKDSGD